MNWSPDSSRTTADQTGGAVLKNRPYVPRKYWQEICPMPTVDVFNMVKQDRADTCMAKQGGDLAASSAKAAARQSRNDASQQRKQEVRGIRAKKKAEEEPTSEE
jgi:hypothetical protein